jgi:TolB-like protein
MPGEIFISYRRADEAWARLLHRELKAEGVEAWYDALIGPGQEWRLATAKALEASQIFVLLFSENAAQSSDIVKELAAATHEKKLVVPVRLQNIEPKGAFLYELASRNWINAYENTEAKLAELARNLARLVKDGVKDESVLPIEHAASGKAKPPWISRNWSAAGGAALIAVAAATGGYYMSTHRPAPALVRAHTGAVRIAVLPFDVLGDDAALRQFSGGLQAEVVAQLNQNQVSVVSGSPGANLKAQGPGAMPVNQQMAYVFAGTIERSGKQLLVRVHLDDARQSVTVWSSEFTGDQGDPRALQDQVSAQTALVGTIVVHNDKLANGDTDAMSLLIKANGGVQSASSRESSWDTAKALVAKFPNNALIHSSFALESIALAIASTPQRAAELRAGAKIEARHALALDPHDPYAYFAQSFLFPSVGHWAERETFLLQGLSVMPQDEVLTNIESNFLREVGRLNDAVAYGRQTQAVLPPTFNRDATLILALSAAGNSFEAGQFADIAAKAWPARGAVWNARFEMAIFNSRWDDALLLLAPGGLVPLPGTVADALSSALKAAKSGEPGAKRRAVRDLVVQLDPTLPWASKAATPPNEVVSPGSVIGMIAILGDKDAAFAQSKAYLKRDSYADSSFLFWPNLAEFRRDPRFIPLATQVGLIDYWRSSGKWPDFCNDKNLPYDCRSNEAEYSPAADIGKSSRQ